MNKKRISIIITLTLFIGVLGFLYIGNESEQSKRETNNNNIISVDASWGEEFSTVDSLIKESDLIIIGSLQETLSSYQPFNDYEDTFTDAKINIEKTLKGEKIPKELIISQYGGEREDGKIEVFEDLPLMDENEKFLLFLEYIDDNTDRNGKYQPVRGVQGYYIIENGNIKSLVNGEINNKVTNKGINGINQIINK